MTFGATAFAVNYTGAHPIFVDSEPLSWNMDPVQLAELLESRSRVGKLPTAVLPVDIYGQAADYTSIEAVCARPDERDAFGRRQSELNRQTAVRMAERMIAPNIKHCLP